MVWIVLGCAIALSAAAQGLFKHALSASATVITEHAPSAPVEMLLTLLRPGVLGGLVLYGISTLLWLMALKRLELSLAYPFVAVGIVLTSAAGSILFQETLSATRVGGIALICLGVSLVGLSAK